MPIGRLDRSGLDPPPPPRRQRHRGHRPGCANYYNNILIDIIERILPNGTSTWCLIALAYKKESGEDVVWEEEDVRRNWTRKLCDNVKKPTGATGEKADCILRCIEIEW
jgi:hypothetical protein